MKKIFGLVGLVGLVGLLLATPARAGHVVWNLTDFTTAPSSVRSLSVFPTGAPFTNGAGVIVLRDRVTRSTGTNGSVTVSNVYGGDYRSELLGVYTTTTNWYHFPVTNGTINASDWITAPTNSPAGQRAYTTAEAYALFVNVSGDSMTGGLTNSAGFYGTGGALTNLSLYGVASFPGTTNGLLFNTNDAYLGLDTNHFYLTLAGTAAANGTYTWKNNGQPDFEGVWTNTTGCGLLADPEFQEWHITNASGELYTSDADLYALDAFHNPSLYLGTSITGWTVASGSGPVPTVKFGTNTFLLAELTLRGTGLRADNLYGNGAGVTNVWGTNIHGPITAAAIGGVNSNYISSGGLSFSNLDNDAWLRLQKGVVIGGHGSRSLNRFGWTNTLNKINGRQQFTILEFGDGLGANDMLRDATYSGQTNAFNFAGYKTTDVRGPFRMVSTIGANSQDLTWLKGYYVVPLNGVVTYTNTLDPLGVLADYFSVQYLVNASQGHFKVETQINGGTWTTVSGLNNVAASGTLAGAFVAWSNAVPAKTMFRVTQLDSGKTVSILDGSAVNTTVTNGFCSGSYYGNASVTIAAQQGTPAILAPLMAWWDPSLILYQKIGLGDIANFLPLLTFISTNTPHADVVFCGIYPLTSSSDVATYGEFDYQRTNGLQGFGWAAFDGHAAFVDTNVVAARGWEPVNDVHFTRAGMSAYDALLTHWLALNEFRQPATNAGGSSVALTGAVTASAGSGVTSLGSFTSASLAGALTDESGTGLAIFQSSPTLITPTVASLVNMQHTHQNAAGGGTLDGAAIAAGTVVDARLSGNVALWNAQNRFSGSNYFGGSVRIDGSIYVGTGADMFMTNSHFGGVQSAAPTVAVGAGAGTGATAALDATANDLSGSLTVTTGTGPTTTMDTVIATVTFNRAWDVAPHVVIFAGTGVAGQLPSRVYVTSGTTSFSLKTTGISPGLTASTNCTWHYHAMR